jgi:hypothetical protein
MRRFLIISMLSMAVLKSEGQHSHSIGFGLTATDVCATLRYGYMFSGYEGWLGEKLNQNGIYFSAGKGRYPEWNLAGAKDHYLVAAGFMLGSPWPEPGWFPTINIGIARHWTNTYPGYEVILNQPVFRKWSVEFGSAGQIGHFYPWTNVSLARQLEMTFGIGITF